jgi:excisionase family DNA binding protein
MLRSTLPAPLPPAASIARLLSVQQACEMLGKSRITIWRLMKRKVDPLPAVRVGRNPMFPLDKVLWWIEKQAIN